MRCATGLFALTVVASSWALPAPADADHDVSIFYEELAPHGDWVHSDRYGWVWTPYDVPRDWRPYLYGRWEYTDYGWTWLSDEPFGWATYHYGRWYHDPYYGWAWVPGTEWGPAWVAWREGDQYMGWAPLPPEAEWQADFGLRIGGLDLNVSLGSDAWTFVEANRIIEPHIHRHVVLPTRNVTIIRRAPIVTRYRYVDGRVVNYGIPVERVERVVGRRVYRTPLRIVDATPTRYRSATVRYQDDGLRIYRPTITRRTTTVDPRVYRTRDVDGVRLERRRYSDDRQGVEVRRRSIGGPGQDVQRRRDFDDDGRRSRQMRERDEGERRDVERRDDNRRDVDRRREAQERSRGEERGRREAQERSRGDERRRDDENRKVKKSKPDDDRD